MGAASIEASPTDRVRLSDVAANPKGKRDTRADRRVDELPAHRKPARYLRIHRAQASLQHASQAEPENHSAIDSPRGDQRARRNRIVFSRANPTLRPREIEVVRLIATGLTSKEIARRLRISPLTVRKHRENAMRRLGVHSMAELMHAAARLHSNTPSE